MDNRFTIGAVLSTGFRIWFKNLLPFLLITIVVYIPLIVWGFTVVGDDGDKLIQFNEYSDLVIMLLNMFAAAAITYGVVMELQGQHASIGACFATGLARFFPVFLVGLLASICIVLGTLALVVPGLILLCMFYVSTPAAVLERPGIVGALTRSRELTRGYKLHIFGLLILLGLINYGLSWIAVELVVKSGDADSTIAEFANAATRSRFLYVSLALNVVAGSLAAVMSAVSYYFLRAEKEGTSAQELARIFE